MQRVKKLLILGLMVLPVALRAQNLATTIKVQAMDMATAFMKNDFNTFVRYMHPNIITFVGGKENLKKRMDSAYGAMKMFNVTFKRYSIGTPSEIVEYKDQLQAVLPESTVISTPLGDVTAETSVIVISPDKGANWWFIDTNVYHADKLKNILPDISPKLTIPPPKRPKMDGIDSLQKKGGEQQ